MSSIEASGFLSLDRAPFYNNRAETYREWFAIPGESTAFDLSRQVGDRTALWLRDNPGHVQELSDLYRTLMAVPVKTRIEFESLESPKARKAALKTGEQPLDVELLGELEALAKDEAASVNDEQAAMIALHLLLDSYLFLETEQSPVAKGSSGPPPPPSGQGSPPMG